MSAANPLVCEASPFHEGERGIQEALGVRDEIEPWARRVVRPFLTNEHVDFYASLPFLVAAARDARGRPWATLFAGAPGFAQAPNPRMLEISALPGSGDALAGALGEGADLGLLGIELDTRRRNRVNGRVGAHEPGAIVLSVEQSFGNCPQFIHPREWHPAEPSRQPSRPVRATGLSPSQRRWIEVADTFFIASGHRGEGEHAAFGMDASHRGGPRGFVELEGNARLVFPDYAGNNHFNTLGNLAVDSRAGLLFVDFERGGLLQLTGHTEIDWTEPDQERFPGARRLVRFEIGEVVEQVAVLPLRWVAPEAGRRELRIARKVVESEDVISFELEDASGRALPEWRPGQHLPIEVEPGDGAPAEGRSYSLSNAPGSGVYRISVKREPSGRVSRYLHDCVDEGHVLRAAAPAGDFTLDLEAARSRRPVVLVGAGIGITPLASMLHALADRHPEQPVLLVHGVRSGAQHPLGPELRERVDGLPGARMHVRYSRPRAEDVVGRDYDDPGRVDAELLARLIPGLEAEFHLCGPASFMAAIQAGLEDLGVSSERIHFETF